MKLWMSLLQEQRLRSSLINPCGSGSSSSRHQLQAETRLLASSNSSGQGAAGVLRLSTGESADPACFALDLHRLEGVFFMLLCSFDASVRLETYSALGLLRSLHQQLYTMAEELGVHSAGNVQPPQQPPMPLQQQQQEVAGGVAAGGSGVGGGGVGGSFSSASTLTAVAGAGAGDVASAAGLTPLAGSVASGSGMFFRHKATASRDSADFLQVLGVLHRHTRVSQVLPRMQVAGCPLRTVLAQLANKWLV